jgi:hypothetical protein
MNTKTLLIPFLCTFLAAGCDMVYGVTRSAQVSHVPHPNQVKKTIASVPGVEKVTHAFYEGERPITSHGIQVPNKVYEFTYSGGTNVHGELEFVMDYSGKVYFSQSLLMMNQIPPQAWVDATRPVMKQIEIRLEQECGLTGLSTSVVERCHGVKAK